MREIKLTVQGSTVHASQYRAGVQGEANATALVAAFDESWDGYAKTITFWDALGRNPVKRVLTTDLLDGTQTYRTAIPGEPLALAGECVLVIDGYADGTRARSTSVRMTVEEAPVADDAGGPADPTPTQAEQLQAQIEAIQNADKYTAFREDFQGYEPGEDAFQEQADGNWKFMDYYADGAHHDIVDDEHGKYLRLRMTEAAGRVATVINRYVRGEVELQFDYLPLSTQNTATDFFDVWLLGTALRARVSYKGYCLIYANKEDLPDVASSAPVYGADGAPYALMPGVWYRVKASVKAGRATMKLWARDSGSEPAGDSGPGITSLASEVLSARRLEEERLLSLMFGPMNAAPEEGAYAMGLDNVMLRLSNKGAAGENGADGEKGADGRGVVKYAFDPEIWRWVMRYTDGHINTYPGFSPHDRDKFVVWRDDFTPGRTNVDWGTGSTALSDRATAYYQFVNTGSPYVQYGVTQMDNGYVAKLMNVGSLYHRMTTRCNSWGDYTAQMDFNLHYSPLEGSNRPGLILNLFDGYAFSTGTILAYISAANDIRITDNTGGSNVHVYMKDSSGNRPGLSYDTWYTARLSCEVGKVTMHIWPREGSEADGWQVECRSSSITADVIEAQKGLRIQTRPSNSDSIACTVYLDNLLMWEDCAPADGHTPVKGVDYYTDADKEEMVHAVLAALPDGDEVSY